MARSKRSGIIAAFIAAAISGSALTTVGIATAAGDVDPPVGVRATWTSGSAATDSH